MGRTTAGRQAPACFVRGPYRDRPRLAVSDAGKDRQGNRPRVECAFAVPFHVPSHHVVGVETPPFYQAFGKAQSHPDRPAVLIAGCQTKEGTEGTVGA